MHAGKMQDRKMWDQPYCSEMMFVLTNTNAADGALTV